MADLKKLSHLLPLLLATLIPNSVIYALQVSSSEVQNGGHDKPGFTVGGSTMKYEVSRLSVIPGKERIMFVDARNKSRSSPASLPSDHAVTPIGEKRTKINNKLLLILEIKI